MSASTPDPRYYKDGRGLRPTWRLRLRHPLFSLRFTPLNRLRIKWNDRKRRRAGGSVSAVGGEGT